MKPMSGKPPRRRRAGPRRPPAGSPARPETADVTSRAPMRGFTLIELMVAIAIAALLIFLAAPSFVTFLRNSEVRSTSEAIINGLRAAKSEAARQNQRVMFTLAGGN